jgi:cytochrome P450/limonene-1,2-epoxide hydrolase
MRLQPEGATGTKGFGVIAMTTAKNVQADGSYDLVPMRYDRTEGLSYLRRPGDVYEAEGKWYLTSTEAVRFAQRNPEIFSSARAYEAVSALITLIPLAIAPPTHAQYRRVLDPMLSPKVIASLEDGLRRQIGEIVDGFLDLGECDMVEDVAKMFPTQALLTLFGFPLEDRLQFFTWVDVLVGGASIDNITETSPEQLAAATELLGYVHQHLEMKKSEPGDDILSDILSLTGDEAWTDAELLSRCFMFILAGLDTVTGAIGFTMWKLADDADLRREMMGDPGKIHLLIEEVLRLELPAPVVPRVTTRQVEVCGVMIPADAPVILALATANRDVAAGTDPDAIDLEHAGRKHLSFGGGIHRCLGSHLARRELQITVEEFHARISDYQLADGYQPQVALPSGALHLEALSLTFTARASQWTDTTVEELRTARLEAAIGRLTDESAIRAVISRYSRGVGRRDWTLLRSLYHREAKEDHGVYNGDIDGYVETLQQHCTADQAWMHMLAPAIIDFDEGNSDLAFSEHYALANCRMTEGATTDFLIRCRYVDRLERRGRRVEDRAPPRRLRTGPHRRRRDRRAHQSRNPSFAQARSNRPRPLAQLDRRHFIHPKPKEYNMSDPAAIVREFCDLMIKRDPEALRPLLADDAVYQNVGTPAFTGISAILENLGIQFSVFPDSYEYKTLNLVAAGEVVLTERLDFVRVPSGELAGLPVMGAFTVRDGKIVRWTDYWDTALVMKMMTGEDFSALVPGVG